MCIRDSLYDTKLAKHLCISFEAFFPYLDFLSVGPLFLFFPFLKKICFSYLASSNLSPVENQHLLIGSNSSSVFEPFIGFGLKRKFWVIRGFTSCVDVDPIQFWVCFFFFFLYYSAGRIFHRNCQSIVAS